MQQGARFGVHGGGPELLGIHFAEALEARDGEFFFGVFEDVAEQRRAISLVTLSPLCVMVKGGLSFSSMAWRSVRRRLYSGVAASAQLMRRSPPFLRSSSCRLCSSSNSSFGFELELGFFDGLGELLQFLLVGEVGFLFEIAFGEQLDELGIAQAAAEFRGNLVVLLNIQQELREVAAFERFAALAFHDVLFGGALHQFASEIRARRGCSGPFCRA